MLYVVPLALVLVAGGIAQLPRRAGVVVAVLLALLAGRALSMHPAFAESVELRRAADWIVPRVHAGEPVFCSETHGYLFFEHYHRELRPRLLLVDSRLPYYEGALLIPDSVRVGTAALDSARGGWFAVRTKHAGMDGAEAAKRFDARTGGPSLRWDIVSAWAGTPAPH